MSKTLPAVTRRRIIATLHPDKLSLILGSEHMTRRAKDGFDLIEIMKAIQAYNEVPAEESWDLINRLINPAAHILEDVSGMEGILTKDSKGQYYVKGTQVPLPHGLLKAIIRFHENELDFGPLINFWNLSLINPNTTARDSFYDYCEKFDVTITPAGYAVLYKAVYVKEGATDNGLNEFVAKESTRIRAQKKGLKSFLVCKAADGVMVVVTVKSFEALGLGSDNPYTLVGNLAELHEKMGDVTSGAPVYTDMHSQKMRYRLGEVSGIPREQCDPNINIECSYGLHVGSYAYVKGFANNNSVVLTVLVDPSMVVAVPAHDKSKMRVCEFFSTGIMERDTDGKWNEIESPFFEDSYLAHEQEAVSKMAQGILPEKGGIVAPTEVQMQAAAMRLVSMYE